MQEHTKGFFKIFIVHIQKLYKEKRLSLVAPHLGSELEEISITIEKFRKRIPENNNTSQKMNKNTLQSTLVVLC